MMTTSDYYTEAVKAWKDGDKKRKQFAELAAQISNRQTATLAADCGISVDTVESYRNAYILYGKMFVNLENPRISEVWESLNISVWIAAAKRQNLHSMETLFDYLQTAAEHNMTVEQFRTELDSRSATKPEWTARLQNVVKALFKLRTDWKTEIPAPLRKEFEDYLKGFESLLKKIAEAE